MLDHHLGIKNSGKVGQLLLRGGKGLKHLAVLAHNTLGMIGRGSIDRLRS